MEKKAKITREAFLNILNDHSKAPEQYSSIGNIGLPKRVGDRFKALLPVVFSSDDSGLRNMNELVVNEWLNIAPDNFLGDTNIEFGIGEGKVSRVALWVFLEGENVDDIRNKLSRSEVGRYVEAIMPAGKGLTILRLAKNHLLRPKSPIRGTYRNIELANSIFGDRSSNLEEKLRKVINNGYTIETIDPRLVDKETVDQVYKLMYPIFGYEVGEIEEMMKDKGYLIIVSKTRGGQIVSVVVGEMKEVELVYLRDFNSLHYPVNGFRIVEVTDAVTDIGHSRNGLMSTLLLRLFFELEKREVDFVYSENNGKIVGMLAAALNFMDIVHGLFEKHGILRSHFRIDSYKNDDDSGINDLVITCSTGEQIKSKNRELLNSLPEELLGQVLL